MREEEQEIPGLGRFGARSRRDATGVRLVVFSEEDAEGFDLELAVRPAPALRASTTLTPRAWWGMEGLGRGGAEDVFACARRWLQARLGEAERGARWGEYRVLLGELAAHALRLCDAGLRRLVRGFRPQWRFALYGMLQREPTGRMAQLAQICPGAVLFAAGLAAGPQRTRWLAQRMSEQVARGRKLDRILAEAVEAWTSGRDEPPRQLPLFPRMLGESTPTALPAAARLRLLIRRARPRVDPAWLLGASPSLVVPEDIPAEPEANAVWYEAMSAAASEPGAELAAFLSRRAIELARAEPERSVGDLVGELRDYLLATGRRVSRATSPSGLLEECARWHARPPEVGELEEQLGVDAGGRPQPIALPPPPLPELESGADIAIRPIRTLEELVREGSELRHCVVFRARRILDGCCAIYAARVGPERLTVELVREPGGAWRLGEVRGSGNARPGEAARAILEAWAAREAQNPARSSPPARIW